MFRKSIPMVALAALLAVTMAYAQEGTSTGASSTPAATTAPAKAPKAAKAMKTSAKKSATHMAKLDLNSASKEDLMKLPGVGDATAEKIIAARPFKTKAELTSKGVVTKKEYAAIASKVIAKQEPTAASSK